MNDGGPATLKPGDEVHEVDSTYTGHVECRLWSTVSRVTKKRIFVVRSLGRFRETNVYRRSDGELLWLHGMGGWGSTPVREKSIGHLVMLAARKES